MTFKLSPGVEATNIDWDPIIPSTVYVVMQGSQLHHMASFPVGVFTDEELANWVVVETKARGESAWIEKCAFDWPKEDLFVEWDRKIAEDKLKNDKTK